MTHPYESDPVTALSKARLAAAIEATGIEPDEATQHRLLGFGSVIDFYTGEGDEKETFSVSDYGYLLRKSPEDVERLMRVFNLLDRKGDPFVDIPSPSFILGHLDVHIDLASTATEDLGGAAYVLNLLAEVEAQSPPQ